MDFVANVAEGSVQTGAPTKTAPRAPPAFDRVWYWRARLPERKGQRCRILVRGAMNSAIVEFEDGCTVVTSAWAVRRAR